MSERFSHQADRARIDRAAAALKAHGIDAVIVGDAATARAEVLDRIPAGSDVFTMSSITLDTAGITAALNESSDYVSVRNKLYALDRATQGAEMRALGAAPSWAVGSVQAITESGELVIASMTGSQLSAYVYGAEKVIFVVGAQKIVKDLGEAHARVREHALPLESERAKAAYGVPGSAINKILEIHGDFPGRIAVIIVEQELGY
ncbi:MAG: LUD domain-containing protein [Candidatus Limnocylindrus sp.]